MNRADHCRNNEDRQYTAWLHRGLVSRMLIANASKTNLDVPRLELGTPGEIIGSVMRPLTWLTIALVLGWLIYLILKHYPLLERVGWRGLSRATPPIELFGLQLQPESLPPDVPAEVRRLLAVSDLRGALSLLYRGALIAILAHENIAIPEPVRW